MANYIALPQFSIVSEVVTIRYMLMLRIRDEIMIMMIILSYSEMGNMVMEGGYKIDRSVLNTCSSPLVIWQLPG